MQPEFVSEDPEQKFARAAAHAALFELRIRLLAGKLSVVGELPIDTKLSKVVDGIIDHVRSEIDDEGKSCLREALLLRNKFLHCEFSHARARLYSQGRLQRTSGARVYKNITAENLKQTFHQMAKGEGGELVADTATKKHKDVAIWLLEAAYSGDFDAMISMFQKANVLLNALLKTEEK